MPGYSLAREDFSKIDAKFFCTKCNLVLREVVQTHCGHNYCKSCLHSMINIHSNPTCLKCEQILEQSRFTPHNVLAQEISCLIVACLFKDDGCGWIDELRHHEDHCNRCSFRHIQCINDGCPAKIPPSKLAHHQEEECPFRTAISDAPSNAASGEDGDFQLSRCPIAQIGKCTMKYCPYKEYGCPHDELMTQGDLNKHLSVGVPSHQLVLLDMMKSVLKASDSNHRSEESHNPRHNLDSAESSSPSLGSVFEIHSGWCRGMVNQMKALKKGVLALFKRSDDQAESIACQETQVSSQGRAMCAMQLQLASHEHLLGQLMIRATQLLNLAQQPVEGRVEALEDMFNHMMGNMVVLSRAVRAQENNFPLRFQENQRQNQVFSYNGKLEWKIENVHCSIAQARINPEAFITSPVFYTSRGGYKICARVYLNGHGNARNTHLSLFFVMMKGEFDAILPWPFSRLVEFRLICQDLMRDINHDQFLPDPQNPAFARPVQDSNDMFGFPHFCPLADLERNGCICDGVMFIKVTVHEK